MDAYDEGLMIDCWFKPGRVEKILARDASTHAAKLRTELVTIDAKKDELAVMLADDKTDAGQFAVASARLADRAKAITTKLATIGYRSPLEPLAHRDVAELRSGLTLAQKRAILQLTAEITIKPGPRTAWCRWNRH